MSFVSVQRADALDFILCRVCRERFGEFLTLDSEFDCGKTLLEVFNEHTQLEASINDSLPQMVCEVCVEDLKRVETFVQKARLTDQQFRELLQKKYEVKEENFERIDVHGWHDSLLCVEDNPVPETKQINDEKILDNDDSNDEDLLQNEPADFNEIEVEDVKGEQYEPCKEIGQDEDSSYPNDNKSLTSEEDLTSDKLNKERSIQEDEYVDEDMPFPELGRKQNQKSEFQARPCEECGKIFFGRKALLQHKKTHAKSKDFHCTICPKSFTTRQRQREHIKTHEDPPNFVCEFCSKRFRSRASLQTHCLSHTGERPYTCEICGKAFSQRSILTTHLTLHTGKNTKCPQCPKMFSRPSQLIAHRRTHTGERPYKCNRCDCTYTQKSHLDRHVDSHFGVRYECSLCNKSYTKKSSLKIHMLDDHGDKPQVYRCEECRLDFNKKKAFEYHMSKHRNLIKYRERDLKLQLQGNEQLCTATQ